MPICVVHSFASQIRCECIIGRACSQAASHALFCWYKVTAGSSVENKFAFGKVLFFFSQFNVHVGFWDSADKTLEKAGADPGF